MCASGEELEIAPEGSHEHGLWHWEPSMSICTGTANSTTSHTRAKEWCYLKRRVCRDLFQLYFFVLLVLNPVFREGNSGGSWGWNLRFLRESGPTDLTGLNNRLRPFPTIGGVHRGHGPHWSLFRCRSHFADDGWLLSNSYMWSRSQNVR